MPQATRPNRPAQTLIARRGRKADARPTAARASASSRLIWAEQVSPARRTLLAQETEKGDVAGLAIEVAIEIEQVGFEQRRAVFLHGGAAAEARNAVEQRAIGAAQAHRVGCRA